MLTAALERAAHPSILHVEGELRTPVSSELSLAVEALLVRGERRILLDLGRLVDIDAAGIGELVRVFNTTTAAGGCLVIKNPGSHVRKLLRAAGVLRLLHVGTEVRRHSSRALVI